MVTRAFGSRKLIRARVGVSSMLAEAGICVLGIERVDQEGIEWFDWATGFVRTERRWSGHFRGDPTLFKPPEKKFIGWGHEITL